MRQTKHKEKVMDHGTTECNGKTYTVTTQPECGNYGTDGLVAWYADGTDDVDGAPVRILWMPLQAYLESDQTDDGDACDWDIADEIRFV